MNRIEAVIFDMDGTILNSTGLYGSARIIYLRNLGMDLDDDKLEILSKTRFDKTYDFILEHSDLEVSEKEMVFGLDETVYYLYKHSVSLYPNVKELLDLLDYYGIAYGLATASKYPYAEVALKKANIYDRFDFITTTGEAGIGKDSAKIYKNAASRFGIEDYSKILVFEDALYALKTAKDAGFVTVGMYDKNSYQSVSTQAKVKEVADYYFKNFQEVIDYIKKTV